MQIFPGRLFVSYLSSIRIKLIFSLVVFVASQVVNAQNELDVIRNNWIKYSDAPNSLYHHLTGQAFNLLKERTDAVSGLNTLSDWQQRQNWVKKTLLDIVGPFPEKTPLNAKTQRIIEKAGYRIEHIVYESQPGFYVTSSMFVPKGLKKRDKAPVII